MQPTVSVVVPVYNGEFYLEETIQSVINQSFQDWELLLIDDCSKDNSLEVIRRFQEKDQRIRLLLQGKNQGAAEARNRGVSEAKGRFIAYLDADDIWQSDKLQKELEFMKKMNAAFVFTGYEFADENGKGKGKVVRVPRTISYKEALVNTTIFTSTVLFDTEKISKEFIKMPRIKSEDTACWWRILKTGLLAYGLDENLVLYRRPKQSLSSNKVEAVRRIWNLYRNFEKLGLISSIRFTFHWAYLAVVRRIG